MSDSEDSDIFLLNATVQSSGSSAKRTDSNTAVAPPTLPDNAVSNKKKSTYKKRNADEEVSTATELSDVTDRYIYVYTNI